MIANTPKPPYYAVIFTSLLSGKELEAYGETAQRMVELASQQEGFLGVESAREDLGITVSYWESMEAIEGWKQHMEHMAAKAKGKSTWYKKFALRISKVEIERSN